MALTKEQYEKLGTQLFYRPSSPGYQEQYLMGGGTYPGAPNYVRDVSIETGNYLKSIGITPNELSNNQSTDQLRQLYPGIDWNTAGGNVVTLAGLENSYSQIGAQELAQAETRRVSNLNAFISQYRGTNTSINIPPELDPMGQYTIYNGAFVKKSDVPSLQASGATVQGGNVAGPNIPGLGGQPGAGLFKVPTNSVGPDGKPIYDIFAGGEHLKLGDPRLKGLVFETLPTGQAPGGFESEFNPVAKPTAKPGGAVPIPAVPPIPPDFKTEVDTINNVANNEQNRALDTIINNFGNVDTSKSTNLSDKLLSTIEGVFNTPTPEKPKSLPELFASKKAELGVDKLEADSAGIDAKIQQLDADFVSQQETEEGRLISTGEARRNIGQAEIAYNRQRRDLLVEKNVIANQLSNKLNTLEMVMNFTNQDFTNSTNYYNQQYNRNLGLLNLVLNLEERAETRQDKIKNESQANLNTVYNLMDKQNIKYESLSASQKTSISKLELSAGLPQGITSLISKSSPSLEIKATTSRTDTKGNVYYDVLLTDPKTGAMSVKSIFRGTEEPAKPTEGDKNKAVSRQMFQILNSKKGTDGYTSPTTWNSLRKGWIAEGGSGKTFDENYSQFINPSHPDDYFTVD